MTTKEAPEGAHAPQRGPGASVTHLDQSLIRDLGNPDPAPLCQSLARAAGPTPGAGGGVGAFAAQRRRCPGGGRQHARRSAGQRGPAGLHRSGPGPRPQRRPRQGRAPGDRLPFQGQGRGHCRRRSGAGRRRRAGADAAVPALGGRLAAGLVGRAGPRGGSPEPGACTRRLRAPERRPQRKRFQGRGAPRGDRTGAADGL